MFLKLYCYQGLSDRDKCRIKEKQFWKRRFGNASLVVQKFVAVIFGERGTNTHWFNPSQFVFRQYKLVTASKEHIDL